MFPFALKLDRGLNHFFAALGGLFLLFFLIMRLTDSQRVSIPVHPSDRPESGTVLRTGIEAVPEAFELHLHNPPGLTRWLAPYPLLGDLPESGLLLAVVIIYFVYFRNFSFSAPFQPLAMKGLRALIILLFAFIVVDFLRWSYLYLAVQGLTGATYVIDSPSIYKHPAFWSLLILLRVSWAFRRGLDLQQENEMTI